MNRVPTAPRADVVEMLHGVAVPDPFRRLESADDPETIAWVEEQNAPTRRALDTPERERLRARLRELHRVPRQSVPAVRGGRIFFTENDGTRGQAVLYIQKGLGLKAEGSTVLVDPNALSEDGTTAITCFEPDDTGARVAYGLSRQGSDAQELLVHDVAAGAALEDRLQWVKFASIAWSGDGFFYTRYPEHDQYFCQVRFHRISDPQAADRLVYRRPDAPEVVFDVKVTSEDRHLVIGSYQGASDQAEIHVMSTDDGSEPLALVTGFSAGWSRRPSGLPADRLRRLQHQPDASFDPSDFLWLDAGGTIAVANLRGGGEYGDAWHRAGMRERKQTVFDDFIAAAEWLESTGRAARGRVAIEGGSNGGLLVGACLVQRPDLFGAAICRVPVADMLRHHLFTVGRFWIPEYGCAEESADFAFLHRYSPYHNVIDGAAYPPALVMTADPDDRVAPGMAKKCAARLQEAVAGTPGGPLDAARGGPVLLRVETRAGHGAGKPIEKQVDEQTDSYAFLFHYLTRTSVSEQTRRTVEPTT